MANVLVRDLDDAVLKQLKIAAKAHGRSLQAEIHAVLENAGVRSLTRNPARLRSMVEALEDIVTHRQRPPDSRGSGYQVSAFIVDASVVVKWFVPEIHTDAARRLLTLPHEYFTRPGSALRGDGQYDLAEDPPRRADG